MPRKQPDNPLPKRPRGRPTIFNETLAKTICDLVAQRVPIHIICQMDGMPYVGTLYRWKRDDRVFSAQFAAAREHRADARQDFIDEIVSDVKCGSLDPAAARVIIDAEKWQMGKEKPKTYGDRVTTEVSGPDGAPLVPEGAGTRDLARAILGILKDAKVEGARTREIGKTLPETPGRDPAN